MEERRWLSQYIGNTHNSWENFDKRYGIVSTGQDQNDSNHSEKPPLTMINGGLQV